MEPSIESVQISDLKVKYNLKEPVIKLQRLSQVILEEKTVSASSLLKKSQSQKQNEPRKENFAQQSFQKDGFIDEDVPEQLLLHVPFLQSRIFQASINKRQRGNQWDSSFFLHMNRYKPEESCFFTPPTLPTHPPPPHTGILPPTVVTRKNKAQSPHLPAITFEYAGNKQISKPASSQLLNNQKKRRNAGMGAGCWKCDYCPKTFTHKHNMTTHLLMHTDVKPFVCLLCSAEFRQKGHMIRHIAGYHPYQAKSTLSAGNARGSCAFCGEKFIKIELLRAHILKGHKDKVAPVKDIQLIRKF